MGTDEFHIHIILPGLLTSEGKTVLGYPLLPVLRGLFTCNPDKMIHKDYETVDPETNGTSLTGREDLYRLRTSIII